MTFKRKHAKADEGRRDFRPSLRLTKAEWEKIKAAAHALKMSVSDWAVFKADHQKKSNARDERNLLRYKTDKRNFK